MLQDVPGVQAYLDDVIMTMPRGDNGQHLRAVLQHFREHGVKLRRDKCSFGRPEVSYLGHRINAEGL